MKKIIFFLLSCLCAISAQSQDLVAKIANQLEERQNNFPSLRPYLIFNQEKYAAGDTIYYKIYFFTQDLRPVGSRHVLHVSLINPLGNEVIAENIGVKDGVGFNQLALPDSLHGGVYQLVVYNDWMKNFDASLFYKKRILIVNQKGTIKIDQVDKKSLSFFPESGKLIGGVSNKVVIEAKGFYDKDNGIIFEKNGSRQPITQFTVDANGLSSFIFIPQPEKSYVAEINGHHFELPVIEKDGIATLITTNPNGKPIQILLTAPEESVYRTQELMLLVISNGKIYYTADVSLKGKEFVKVFIPQTNLPPGVAQLSIFANDKNLADRLLLINESQPVKVVFSENDSVIQSRGKISIDFTISDPSNHVMRAEFAASAINQKLFANSQINSFVDDMYLFNETGNEHFDVDRNNAGWYSTFDQWLITKSSKTFDVGTEIHPMELKYDLATTLTMRAKVYFEDTGKPVPDSTVVMMYLQKKLVGYEAYVKDGMFDFDFFFDFYGSDEVFYVAEFKGKELQKVKVEIQKEAVAVNDQDTFTLSKSDKDDSYAEFHTKKQLVQKSYSYYASPSKEQNIKITNPHEDFEDELMNPDISVDVQKYIVFPTMEEIIREVIPALTTRKHGGKTIVRIYLSVPTLVPTGDPLYLIDGVMTKNTEYFLSLKPADILTIKIFRDVNKLNRFGALGKNGIVIVQSKKTDVNKLKESSSLLPVNGFTKPLHFKNVDYSLESPARIPDFRSTLYWNPLMKTDTNGKGTISFYASDDVGPVEIKITGMTSDGRPFSGSKIINVVPAVSGYQKK
jgi:hypothetical protein